MTAVLGVAAGSRTATDAEHLILGVAAELGAGPGAVLCTHAVREGTPHYAATLPVADALAGTAIDEVRVLAGGALPPAAVRQTREFCRPVYEAGTLVLHVLPAGPGRVAPFEVPDPTPCCAAHS
jgi:hypothetical protein